MFLFQNYFLKNIIKNKTTNTIKSARATRLNKYIKDKNTFDKNAEPDHPAKRYDNTPNTKKKTNLLKANFILPLITSFFDLLTIFFLTTFFFTFFFKRKKRSSCSLP